MSTSPTQDPIVMADNRKSLVDSSGGTLKEENGIVVPATRNPAVNRVNPDTVGATSPVLPDNKPAGAPLGSFSDYKDTLKLGSDITNEISSRYQTQAQAITDAITSKYASKIENDKSLIASQDARARVLNTRTGVTDSGTGSTAINTVQEKGNKLLESDRIAQTNEITAALGKIDNLKKNEILARDTKNRNDLISYNNLRAKNKIDAETSLKALGTSGVDLKTLQEKEPETYKTLLNTTGMSPLELDAKYNSYKKAADQTKYQYKIVGDTIVAYGVNSKGELITSEETVPGLSSGNFEIKETKDGELYKVDKTTGDITKLRNAETPTENPTTQQKNERSSALNWLRAQPDYKPEYENQFNTDPVIRAKVIEAWKGKKVQVQGGRAT